MELEEHYGQLLGVETPWDISSIDLNMQDHCVDVVIEYTDDQGPCPECGTICPKHDDRKKRTWRHLDTMQFSTYLHCEVPRVRCDTHGIKTVTIPWAGKNSRFTLLFEAFAIRVLTASRSVEEARKLLGLNWHQVETIKGRAVQRGLARRKKNTIRYLGIDEKQFRSGHRYISNLYDLEGGRVLEVVEERTSNKPGSRPLPWICGKPMPMPSPRNFPRPQSFTTSFISVNTSMKPLIRFGARRIKNSLIKVTDA